MLDSIISVFSWIIENWVYIASVALGFCVIVIVLLIAAVGTIADIGSSVIKNVRG